MEQKIISEWFGGFFEEILLDIRLNSLYLSESKEVNQKLEDFYTKNLKSKTMTKRLFKKAEKFLKKLAEQLEDGAQAEHLAMI